MKEFQVMSLALILTLAMADMSFGATASGTLNLSATVVPTCTVSTTPVNFENYDGYDAHMPGEILVTCSSAISYHIALDAGQSFNGDSRGMRNGVDRLNYWLSKDSTLKYEWGDSDYDNTYPWGSSIEGYTKTGKEGVGDTYTVYGFLLGPPYNPAVVSPGTFSDVVNVTVFY
jgi:spore coat protein U-like protein